MSLLIRNPHKAVSPPRHSGRKPAASLRPALILLLLLPAPAFAQTAERLDAVLDAERVSFAQAAALILPAAGLLPPDAGEAEAFAKAGDWLPRRAERDLPIRMGELSHLLMRSFGLSGGFLYALFPGPRYAYRALAWRRLLPPAADPGRTLNGEELLYIMGQVLSFTGEAEVPADAPALEAIPEPDTGGQTGMTVEQGRGLSSGPEEIIPYKGEFEIE